MATSTKMLVPDWCPVVLEPSHASAAMALEACPLVCVGCLEAESGKLSAPELRFSELSALADYVLVEADGSKGLPLKAHAAHEPVIPTCASRVVCVLGIDGVGGAVSRVCHRPELYAQLADASPESQVTPEMVASVLLAEHFHDAVYINKVEQPAQWLDAESLASFLTTPVVAGSLWRNEFTCLR